MGDIMSEVRMMYKGDSLNINNERQFRPERPLKLFYCEMYSTKEEAHKKELWLKKQKNKKVIKDFMAL